MLPIRNISYLLPMCFSLWEKCKNSPKTGLGCSTPLNQPDIIYGGGYFHRNAIRRCCRPNGSVFDKKFLNMGPIFDPQIPKHGSIFRQNHKNFLGSQRKPRKFSKNPKHGSIFWAKSLNMGTFFTSKHGLGSRGPGGTPPSKPKSSTPPRIIYSHWNQCIWIVIFTTNRNLIFSYFVGKVLICDLAPQNGWKVASHWKANLTSSFLQY